MTITVLMTAPYMIPFLDRFNEVFVYFGLELIVPDVAERMEEADLLKYAGQFDGTICGDDRYTQAVIEACLPRLKVISKWGTGIDSIDQDAAAKHGVMIGNTLGAFTQPVADSIMGYILAFARRGPWMDKVMKAGQWQKMSGRALSESTVGVIGVGNIGKAVVKRASAFDMNILGNDIIEIDSDFVRQYDLEMTDLESLLERSDFVCLCCDLNPASQKIINAQTLQKMKPSAVLVNTARGPLVDESALIAALQNESIAGAALDVFEVEPLPQDSPLLKMDNVLLAPHNANSSPEAWERVHWNSIRNLLTGLGMEPDELERFNV